MVYAMSNLYGCYDMYIKMLKKINLGENDKLYILGDVVDKGRSSMEILLDMMKRENVIPIRGEHDHLAYELLSYVYQPYEITRTYNMVELEQAYERWFADGGRCTYNGYKLITPEERKEVMAYLKTFRIYDEIEAGSRKYFMTHIVTENMSVDSKIIVTGHKPAKLIDKGYKSRIYKEKNHIALDCDVVHRKPLGCICLDSLEEFYVDWED